MMSLVVVQFARILRKISDNSMTEGGIWHILWWSEDNWTSIISIADEVNQSHNSGFVALGHISATPPPSLAGRSTCKNTEWSGVISFIQISLLLFFYPCFCKSHDFCVFVQYKIVYYFRVGFRDRALISANEVKFLEQTRFICTKLFWFTQLINLFCLYPTSVWTRFYDSNRGYCDQVRFLDTSLSIP